MSEPQSAILPEPRESALFVFLDCPDRAAAAPEVARAAATIPGLTTEIAARDEAAGLVSTVAFGPELWDAVSPGRRPAALRPFGALEADGRTAPSTGGDLLLHVVSSRPDLNAELLLRARARLGAAASVREQIQGFRYLDSRDLTGFIDGTENPSGEPDRRAAALIGDEDPEFAGSSYVFTQRYVHDLARWASLEVAEQERIIGRRKSDSEELAGDLRPATAHISRVVYENDGVEQEIVRHSFPYLRDGDAGLPFLAYTRDLAIPETMLARMIGTAGDGAHDRLMEFTRTVSGAHFFAPSLELLRGFA